MLQIFLKGQLNPERIGNFYSKLNDKPESHKIRFYDYDIDIVSGEGQKTSTRESFYYGSKIHSDDIITIREYFEGFFEKFMESYGDVPDMVHLASHSFSVKELSVGRFFKCRANLYKNIQSD